MRKATSNDVGKTAIVTTTDVFNGAEVKILKKLGLSDEMVLVQWPNERTSSMQLSKLEIKE